MSDTRSRLAVILHADIVGSTDLVRANHELAHKRMQWVFQLAKSHTEMYGGSPLEIRGDAYIAEFELASDAVCAALKFQHENIINNDKLDDSIQPCVRIGIALGEVVIADNTVTGEGVVLAQRLEQLAQPGAICIQSAIQEAIPEHFPFEYTTLGEKSLKGFVQPVRASLVTATDHAAIPPGRGAVSAKSKQLSRIKSLPTTLLLAAITIGLFAYFAPKWMDTEPTSKNVATIKNGTKLDDAVLSIAVLPFDNVSGNSDQEYVSDGLTDNIITSLSRVPDLLVIARNSSFVYKANPVNAQEAANALGVRYIVEGSFQREGDDIRIHTQLVDATTGHQLWAERFDRTFAGIFALQDDVTNKVVTALELKLTDEQKSRLALKFTNNIDAFDKFLRGQSLFLDFSQSNNELARELYSEAIELDPEFARAHGALSLSHSTDYRFGWSNDGAASLNFALSTANSAIELNGELPQAHLARSVAFSFGGNQEEALVAINRAIELDHNFAEAYAVRAMIQTFLGNADSSVQSARTAIRLSPPGTAIARFILGRALLFSNRLEEAESMLQSAVSKNSSYLVAQIYLIVTYSELERLDDAEWQATELLDLQPDFSIEQWTDSELLTDPTFAERVRTGLQRAGLPD